MTNCSKATSYDVYIHIHIDTAIQEVLKKNYPERRIEYVIEGFKLYLYII